MDLGIAGKVALVTGGSRGLGKQAALALAREGCVVAVCARNPQQLDQVTNELQLVSPNSVGFQADVTTMEGCNIFYSSSTAALGEADILVNNVGGTSGGREFDTTTDEDWTDTLDLNLFSAIRMMRVALPHMKEGNWGRVVNVASLFGREYGGALSYMTTKAALIAFSKHMALSLAAHNVLVNTISPGSITFPGGRWDNFQKNNNPDVVHEFISRNLPMGKFGWPEPIGELIAFLCSEKADLITGASIGIDGGQARSLI
ncbi:MAG: SDR family NAD(P)-dependent oxidoreductase [Chloroflexota bacterium]|nr:SDR family NAD(P)-dependent oxidoreductase [Chloroflexota bacterium]